MRTYQKQRFATIWAVNFYVWHLPVLYQALEALISFEWMNFISSEQALELLSQTGLMPQLLRLLHSLLYAPAGQQRLLEMAVDVLAYALEAESPVLRFLRTIATFEELMDNPND